MTLAKRLLLGTAAAFVATSGAHAADLGLPVAPSVDYVQICSIGSFTGFLLPGGDVCFDISGYARGQLTWTEEIDPFTYGTGTLGADYELDAVGAANTDVYNIVGGATAAVNGETLSQDFDQFPAGNAGAVEILLESLANTNVRAAVTTASASLGYSGAVLAVDDVLSENNAVGQVTLFNGGTDGDGIEENNLLVVTPFAGFAAGTVLENLGGVLNTLSTTPTNGTGNNDEMAFLGNARLNFDARTMTEYGLLRGFIRLDGENGGAANVDRAFVQLNVGSLGFTAGLADSVFDPVFTGYGAGTAIGVNTADQASNQFSVNAAVGNGVTVSLSVEDDDARIGGVGAAPDFMTLGVDTVDAVLPIHTFGTAAYDGGASVPDIIAAIRVDQAWGSAKLAAALHEVNPAGSAFDSEFGYAVSASAEVNLPVGVGSTFGITGIYANGAQGFMGFDNIIGNSVTGYADATLVTTTTAAGTTRSVELTTSYVLAAGFNFGLSDMVALQLDGSYADVDHHGTIFDGNVMTIRGGISYVPVNNLTINAHVAYAASDFNSDALRAAGTVDDDEWSARFRVTRAF